MNISTLTKKLAQACEKAARGNWCLVDRRLMSHHVTEKYDSKLLLGLDHPDNLRYIALANPENIKTILSALEEAKKVIEFYGHGRNWSEMGNGAYADIGKRARQWLEKWDPKTSPTTSTKEQE